MNHYDEDKTLLIVEDEAIIAMSQARVLEKHGYLVVTVGTGEEAVSCVSKRSDIQLVLMDIDLGKGIDGTEAAVKILEIRELPIVFLTSHSEKKIVEKVKNITRYGYVLKSSGEFVLVESINMAFELFEVNLRARKYAEELEMANEELKNAEELYRNLFMNAQVGLFRTDIATGKMLEANDALAHFAGYDNTEDLFMDNYNIAEHYLYSEHRKEMISIINEKGAIRNFEAPFVRKDGATMWIRFSARISGNGQWIEGVSQDVTTERKTKEALRLSEEKYRTYVELAPDAIFIFNGKKQLVDANRSASQMVGYLREELLEMSIMDILRPGNPRENPASAQKIKTGTRLEGEVLLRKKDGTDIAVYMKSVALSGECFMAFCSDR